MPRPAKKVRLLRIAPRSGAINQSRERVYLRSGRRKISLPLKNEFGFLNGVYRTPKGEIVELRYIPKNTIVKDFGGGLRRWATQWINVIANGELIGEASPTLGHRIIDREYRGIGLGNKLYDLGEKAIVAAEPKRKGRVKLSGVSKKEAAKFLLHRGYRPYTAEEGKKIFGQINSKNSERFGGKGVKLIKAVKATKYDDPRKWHRIEVIGSDGKTKFLTLRVVSIDGLENAALKKKLKMVA